MEQTTADAVLATANDLEAAHEAHSDALADLDNATEGTEAHDSAAEAALDSKAVLDNASTAHINALTEHVAHLAETVAARDDKKAAPTPAFAVLEAHVGVLEEHVGGTGTSILTNSANEVRKVVAELRAFVERIREQL